MPDSCSTRPGRRWRWLFASRACSAGVSVIISPPLNVKLASDSLTCPTAYELMARDSAAASFSRICCKSFGSDFEPFFVHLGDQKNRRLSSLGDEFRRIDHVEIGDRSYSGDGAVDRALLNGRQYVAERHRHRRDAKPLERFALKLRRKNSDFLALKVGEVPQRHSRNHHRLLGHEQPHAVQSLVGAEAEHQLEHYVDRPRHADRAPVNRPSQARP